jgi:hypothetical protein
VRRLTIHACQVQPGDRVEVVVPNGTPLADFHTGTVVAKTTQAGPGGSSTLLTLDCDGDTVRCTAVRVTLLLPEGVSA